MPTLPPQHHGTSLPSLQTWLLRQRSGTGLQRYDCAKTRVLTRFCACPRVRDANAACCLTGCSCDRRGTQVTHCPLGSPCFCDPLTGQCPCRKGVVGILCDECEDGFWNMGGAAGCQPCSCDPANSLSYICDKARAPNQTTATHAVGRGNEGCRVVFR